MRYKEEYRDLFTVGEEYRLAHCVSADFVMGAGIAVQFNRHSDMKNRLRSKYPRFIDTWDALAKKGTCVAEGRVYNLVTKRVVRDKPTYDSLRNALICMRDAAVAEGVRHIAMPRIGCGIDGLRWDEVSAIIYDVFANTDIDILVCVR